MSPTTRRIRDGATIIGLLEGGELVQDIGRETTALVAELTEVAGDRPKSKAKGSVTITLSFEVEEGMVTINATLAVKKPKRPRATSVFWGLHDGSLSTEHPKQTDLFAGPREARARDIVDA